MWFPGAMMTKCILINAINLTGSGAQAIGLNLLPALLNVMTDSKLLVLLPDSEAFRSLALPGHAEAVFFKRRSGWLRQFARLLELSVFIPLLARRFHADVCLTLGDYAPMMLPCQSVIFLQQPLLIYSEAELAGLRGWSPLKWFFLTKYFGWTLHSNTCLIVQTPVMATRVSERYGLQREKVTVIPQPVPDHVVSRANSGQLNTGISSCRKPVRLLFLAACYPHKNHAIVPKVAAELRRRGLAERVHIFLTINGELPYARRLLQESATYPDIITNLGPLPSSEVMGALRASTALFLPSLAESFGLIYLEAMACGTPILTSDRDFARWMCGNLAVYFDPLDPVSIVDSVTTCAGRNIDDYRVRAQERLAEFPRDWYETAVAIARLV